MNPAAKTVKPKKGTSFRDQFVGRLLLIGLKCEEWAAANNFHPSLVSLAINGRQLDRPVVRRIRTAAERLISERRAA